MIEPAGPADGLLIAADGAAEQVDPARRSRLVPGSAVQLLHADLHNHTLLSDGDGRPEEAFSSMRAAGLDVAAVTDHAHGPGVSVRSIDEGDWRRLGELADAADEPGEFVAVRGFEWTSPSLGHMNVWGGRLWTRPLPLAADGARRSIAVPPGPPDDPAAMAAFYDWLAAEPDAVGGGGADALVSFNHPGREIGRFGRFRFDPRLVERVVGLEMFNRTDDYLFERVDAGGISPLVECLDAGWRVGLIGVTDEHGRHWGFPRALGRTGIWAPRRDRAGVRAALRRRRVYATRERGLRADAIALGPHDTAVPMGSTLVHDRGDLRFRLDVEGAELDGGPLRVQLLQTGRPLPRVIGEQEYRLPLDGPIEFTAPVARDDGDWVVLRLSQPDRAGDRRARRFPDYRSSGRSLAYLSPFFLSPE